MRRTKPRVGDVVQLTLPDGRYAYGRVLRDASVAFYRQTGREPGQAPFGSRDYQFVVGVYDDVLQSSDVTVVGHDPATSPEDEWPPPYSVTDRVSGAAQIYRNGVMRPATADQVRGLEPAAVWDLQHLLERLAASG
jgi:Immunity protein 26